MTTINRNQSCYVKLHSKWKLATFIGFYPELSAAKARFMDNEWTVDAADVVSIPDYNKRLREDFETQNAKLIAAFRAAEKPVKAKIARELGTTVGKMRGLIIKAKKMEVSLDFVKPD